jgi:extradiol dioxygenase family protein
MLSHNSVHATLPAADLARAKAFHGEKLGLTGGKAAWFKDSESNLLGIIQLG